MTMTHTSLLQIEVTDQVATRTFNSPGKPNALEPGIRDELAVPCKKC
jgi:2-(1,2-epoxy-1,2-dihydrophenyl)acetyl-CoA isomerase